MKYNKRISDYNSSTQKFNDIQIIGNVMFNKLGANKKDQQAWLRFKEYVKRLEKQLEEQMNA